MRQVLGLASNRLPSLRGVETVTTLTEIYADHNGISDTSPLAPLTSLVTLDLGANRFSSLDASPLSPTIEELWLTDNPLPDLDCISPLLGRLRSLTEVCTRRL